ncbi:MAG: hypothetical protein SPI77_04690 [Corynebacterium sp.]|nr:hypothetical protein [Corynebacterium sp.]
MHVADRNLEEREREAVQAREQEEQTAAAARRIVATYGENDFDAVTIASMLGIMPKEFDYDAYAATHTPPPAPAAAEDAAEATEAKKTTAKKTTAKKTTAKKTTAKKTTAKKTTAKK